MKNHCEIVQDLLPLYLDDTLHTNTKEFVYEHLQNCAECKKQYAELKMHQAWHPPIAPVVRQNSHSTQDMEFVHRIRKWKRNTSMIGVLILLLFSLLFWYIGKTVQEPSDPVMKTKTNPQESSIPLDWEDQYGRFAT